MSCSLTVSKSAAAELIRQSAFGGTPGEMHIDLLPDGFDEGWLYIRVRCGQQNGTPIARRDGVTLFAPVKQLSLLKDLSLDYSSDISGGGFLISTPEGAEASICGSGFKLVNNNKDQTPL